MTFPKHIAPAPKRNTTMAGPRWYHYALLIACIAGTLVVTLLEHLT